MKPAETAEQDFRQSFIDAWETDGADTQYVLVHVVSGKGCARLGPLVRRFERQGNVERLLDRILHVVRQDCRGIGFAQKYGVFLFDERRSSEHLARFILSMRPKA